MNIFLLFGIKYFNLDKIFYNYKRKRKGNMQAIKQTKSTIPEIKDDFKTIIGELKPNLHASYNVSNKAKINITNDNINIYEPQEQSHFNINMGTDNHWIIVKDTNIGKGKKPKKIKSVLIYEKIYICPFSKLYFLKRLTTCYNFIPGFAYNQHTIMMGQHKKFKLDNCYYVPRVETIDIGHSLIIFHLCLKIHDNRTLNPEIKAILAILLNNNYDMVDYIHLLYDGIVKKHGLIGPLFSMDKKDLTIDPKQSCTKEGLKVLFDKGYIEVGITSFGGINIDNICMLSKESYNHIFPNGNRSPINSLFNTSKEMYELRNRFITNYFGELL